MRQRRDFVTYCVSPTLTWLTITRYSLFWLSVISLIILISLIIYKSIKKQPVWVRSIKIILFITLILILLFLLTSLNLIVNAEPMTLC